MTAVIQFVRIAAVMALVGVAAAIATPRGRLPLALRGVLKTLGRPVAEGRGERVPVWKRALAFALVLVALVLTLIPASLVPA